MIIQVECAGNLGLVHAMFILRGLNDAIKSETAENQQLVAHLGVNQTVTPNVLMQLAQMVSEGSIAAFTVSGKAAS